MEKCINIDRQIDANRRRINLQIVANPSRTTFAYISLAAALEQVLDVYRRP